MANSLSVFSRSPETNKPEKDGFSGFMTSFGNVIQSVYSTISSGLNQIFEITGLKKLSQTLMSALGVTKQENMTSKVPIKDSPESPNITDALKTASAFTPIGGLIKGGEALINAGKSLISDKAPNMDANDMEAKLRSIVAQSAAGEPSGQEKNMKF